MPVSVPISFTLDLDATRRDTKVLGVVTRGPAEYPLPGEPCPESVTITATGTNGSSAVIVVSSFLTLFPLDALIFCA